MQLAKYNKLIVAVVGGLVTFASLYFNSPDWLSGVTIALTALGVYQAPNKKQNISTTGFQRKSPSCRGYSFICSLAYICASVSSSGSRWGVVRSNTSTSTTGFLGLL